MEPIGSKYVTIGHQMRLANAEALETRAWVLRSRMLEAPNMSDSMRDDLNSQCVRLEEQALKIRKELAHGNEK